MRTFTTTILLLLLALSVPGPGWAGDAAWEEVVFLAWGTEADQLGRTFPREDELPLGPHGIAAAADGTVAVIDQPRKRALVVGPDGELLRTIDLPGWPGAAALLPDGTLAVADQRRRHAVHVVGEARDTLLAPSWALPPARLVAWESSPGQVALAGMDGMQNRLPLAAQDPRPAALPRGVPTADGVSVWAVKRDAALVVGWDEQEVSLGDGAWPALEVPWQPGEGIVLAASADAAVLSLSTVSSGPGPLVVGHRLALVGRDGVVRETLAVPAMGDVPIPDALAALPDGTVWVLVAEDGGCALWRARLGGAR